MELDSLSSKTTTYLVKIIENIHLKSMEIALRAYRKWKTFLWENLLNLSKKKHETLTFEPWPSAPLLTTYQVFRWSIRTKSQTESNNHLFTYCSSADKR